MDALDVLFQRHLAKRIVEELDRLRDQLESAPMQADTSEEIALEYLRRAVRIKTLRDVLEWCDVSKRDMIKGNQ